MVQIVIEHEVGLLTDGLIFELCAAYSRIKYQLNECGAFPALAAEPTEPIARTREYFGSGGQADRVVIVSQDLVQGLSTAKVRGMQYTLLQADAAGAAPLS